MSILMKVILGILILVGYLVVIFAVYSKYTDRDFNVKPLLGKINITYPIFVISLIGLTIFFAAGFEKALFFIPEHWGGLDEEGNWISTVEYTSYALGFFASIGFLTMKSKY